MKRLVLIALACFAVAGCKKAFDKMEKDAYEPAPASGGPNAGGGGGGGGGGAVQAVRKNVTRLELKESLEQIRLFIDTASTDGQMPSIESTYAALQREAPKHAKLVTDGHVVLNRATSRDDVWAYALLPQGNYVVATASGIEDMPAQELTRRLGR